MIFQPSWNIEAIIFVAMLATLGAISGFLELRDVFREWKRQWDEWQDDDPIPDPWNW